MFIPLINGKKTELKDFLFIDVQTVNMSEEPMYKSPSFEDLGKYDVEDFWRNKVYMDPCFSKIHSITLGYITPNKEFRVKTIQDDSEEVILNDFYKFMAKASSYVPAMYNAKFIVPYLRSKSLKYSIQYIWNDCLLKPWEIGLERNSKLLVFDISEYHKGASYFNTPFVKFIESMGIVEDYLTPKEFNVRYTFDKSLTDERSDFFLQSRIRALVKAVNRYFLEEVNYDGGGDVDDIKPLVATDIDLSVDVKPKNYDGLTVVLVDKLKGKKLTYKVQLSDNSDLEIKSKTPPQVGDEVKQYL